MVAEKTHNAMLTQICQHASATEQAGKKKGSHCFGKGQHESFYVKPVSQVITLHRCFNWIDHTIMEICRKIKSMPNCLFCAMKIIICTYMLTANIRHVS